MLKASTGSPQVSNMMADFNDLNKVAECGTPPHGPHLLRRSTDQDRRAFRWLSPTFFDIEEAYDSILNLAHPSTCRWIESRDEYRSWLLSGSAAILGVFGPSGCGKSVLAAKIISSLKQSPQVEGNRPAALKRDYSVPRFYKQQLGQHYWEDLYNVPEPLAYIFCDILPVEERAPNVILSVLLAQLCRQNSQLLEAITARMENSENASASIEDLVMMFEEDVTRIVYRYYLVIDGYDRITSCAKFLLNLSSSTRNIPKILILSRPEPTLTNRLNGSSSLQITPKEVDGDIKLVLPSLTNSLTAQYPNHRQKIEETFLTGHNGSFLWCRVLAKHLEQQVSASDFVATLSHAPTGIFELYTRVLDRLILEPDALRRDIAVRSLKLIAIAQRPLDISELETALSITENETKFNFDERLTQLQAVLRSTCAPLVDIRCTAVHGSMYSVFSATVSFIHPTLEDFLFSSTSTTGHFGLPLSRPLLHTATARLCLTYLSLSEIGNPDHRLQFQRGRSNWNLRFERFLSYAAVYVFDHLSYSGQTGAKDLRLLDELQHFIAAPAQVRTWFRFIKASSPLATLISRQGITKFRYNGDVWHPGMGERFRQWLDAMDNNERAGSKDATTTWLNELMREIWTEDMSRPPIWSSS